MTNAKKGRMTLDYAERARLTTQLDMLSNAEKRLIKSINQRFDKRMVAPALDEREMRFKAGDKRALLEAMAICSEMGRPFPDWVREAFLIAFHSIPKSWDKVFDRPLLKGAWASKARMWRKIQSALYLRVKEMRAQDVPIDDEQMFAPVAEEFHVSAATAKRMYYDYDHRVGASFQQVQQAIQWIKQATPPAPSPPSALLKILPKTEQDKKD
jgi:hypothetical protein